MAGMRITGVALLLALAVFEVWLATGAAGNGRYFALATALVLLLAAAFLGRQRGVRSPPAP